MPGPLLALLGRVAVGGGARGLSRAAMRAGSKVGKNPARRAAARARLRNRGRKKMAREFMEGAFESLGVNTDGIARNQQSRAGNLLRMAGYKPEGGSKFDFDRPVMDQPQRVSKESNPTITSLEKQLQAIAKVATNLGVISKEQQDQLLKSAQRMEAQSGEQALEQPDATPIAAETMGGSIGPAEDAIEKLLNSIANVQQMMDDSVREAQQNSAGNSFMEGMLDSLGLGGVKKARAARRSTPQLRKGFQRTKSKTGQITYRNARGVPVRAEDALKNFKTVDPANLGQKTAKARQASAVLGKSSGRVAGLIGRAAAKGTAAKGAIGAGVKIGKDAIIKAAKPIVSKALVKTGIKSIPVIGAVAGGLFAIGRLLQGDVVGAGLEAASGLGGPLTAIPALALSLTRDVYMNTFGIAPEQDPEAGPRLAMVNEAVTGLIKQGLGQKVTKEGAPGDSGAGADGTATPQASAPAIPEAPKAEAPAPAATPVTAPPPTTTPPAAASTSGDTTATSAPGGTAPPASTAPASAPGGSPQQVSAERTQNRLEGEEGSSPPTTGSAPEVKSMQGEKILQASTEAPPAASTMGLTGAALPRPATLPTTKGRARGMGNVPEPTYLNLGNIAGQLYFGSVAGAMAT
jgi:hypothetical protein